MKHNLILFFIFILIAGCTAQEKSEQDLQINNDSEIKIENESASPTVPNMPEKSMNDSQEEQNKTILNISHPVRLGNLCSGEEDCSNFCSNNRGMCEEYCKGNTENSLCLKIVPPESGSEKVGQGEQTGTIKKDDSPVLKNLGVNIEPWNKQTNLAGDLIFTKKLLFDDGHTSNDKVFLDFGSKDKNRPNDIGSIEYWFYVPSGTKLRAPIDGIAQIVFFEHTQDWGINFHTKENSEWIVSYEHVVDVNVNDGDIVKAGDIVAKAAPRIGNEIAMTELAVWRGGRNVIKYCPFNFLDESLKPTYKEKLNRLARDWEEFIGEDVYEEEKWVAPGCLLHNITER